MLDTIKSIPKEILKRIKRILTQTIIYIVSPKDNLIAKTYNYYVSVKKNQILHTPPITLEEGLVLMCVFTWMINRPRKDIIAIWAKLTQGRFRGTWTWNTKY